MLTMLVDIREVLRHELLVVTGTVVFAAQFSPVPRQFVAKRCKAHRVRVVRKPAEFYCVVCCALVYIEVC